jgi:2-desacetyl-2-hydroxyethyl bacteriochlorophyllide A dehydrogenase
MGTRLVITAPRSAGFESYEDPPLEPSRVRVKTLFSGISSGTELTAYRGTTPGLSKKWDAATRLFLPVPRDDVSVTYPLSFGYEEVGRVIEVGRDVEGVAEGDVIFGGWRHETTHVLPGELARTHKFPAELDPILGIFLGIAPTALNGILDACINVGETVVVFGAGTVGQILTQLAKLSGATVVTADLFQRRLELAKGMGADIVLNPKEVSVAEEVKRLTDGRGADVCLEASGAVSALHEAIRTCAYSAKVVTLGFYQGAANDLFLGDEFHHNRINVLTSQIFGVNPSLMYRWDRPRLDATIIKLLQSGQLRLRELITHVLPFEEGARAFEIADRQPGEAVQIVLSVGA